MLQARPAASTKALKWGAGALILALFAACGPKLVRQDWENIYKGEAEDAFLTDDDFRCITEGEKIGNSYYRNINGHLEETLAVARNPEGGTYPVGTMVQLFPGEAMVKRAEGFSPETNDWEFFVIEVVEGQTIIADRGTTEVRNPLGTCMKCHGMAAPQFDLVCATDRGCKKLPGFASKLAAKEVANDLRCQ